MQHANRLLGGGCKILTAGTAYMVLRRERCAQSAAHVDGERAFDGI
jgi:hypothetical protein